MATKAAQHNQHRKYMPQAKSRAKEIRATQRWKELSEHKRRINPLCEDPFEIHKREGVTTIADHAHHIKPVEERPDLAFTFDNLMSVCTRCHALIEEKAKAGDSCQYFCIFGAPASGKSTYVDQQKKNGELVLDVDALYKALGSDTRDHPLELMPFVLDARDMIMARMRQKHALRKAWIITTTKRVAEWSQQILGARIIRMETSKEECIKRVDAAPDRLCVRAHHISLIEKWFAENP